MSLKNTKKDNKLSPKYYGPYKVLQKIGSMAYKLELPASSRVRLVFHVFCLRKVIGEKLLVQTMLPELDEEGKIILEPEELLKYELYIFIIDQFQSISLNGRNYPRKIQHGKMSPLYNTI